MESTCAGLTTAARFYCMGGLEHFLAWACVIVLLLGVFRAFLYHQDLWLQQEQRRRAAEPGALQILRNIRDTLLGSR
jgi:hypothetical protein